MPGLVWLSGLGIVLQTERSRSQFNSRMGHMPGLPARSPVGGVWEATNVSLPPFLSLKRNEILKKKKKKRKKERKETKVIFSRRPPTFKLMLNDTTLGICFITIWKTRKRWDTISLGWWLLRTGYGSRVFTVLFYFCVCSKFSIIQKEKNYWYKGQILRI